jgi:hypothetical protein
VDSDNTGLLGAETMVDLSKFLTIDMFASKVPNENFNFYGVNFNFDSLIEFTICQECNNSGFYIKKDYLQKIPWVIQIRLNTIIKLFMIYA